MAIVFYRCRIAAFYIEHILKILLKVKGRQISPVSRSAPGWLTSTPVRPHRRGNNRISGTNRIPCREIEITVTLPPSPHAYIPLFSVCVCVRADRCLSSVQRCNRSHLYNSIAWQKDNSFSIFFIEMRSSICDNLLFSYFICNKAATSSSCMCTLLQAAMDLHFDFALQVSSLTACALFLMERTKSTPSFCPVCALSFGFSCDMLRNIVKAAIDCDGCSLPYYFLKRSNLL